MKRAHVLPNLITLANAFCGLLALARAIDALALSGDEPIVFYQKMESACFLVFLGMVFDSLDGLVARLTRGYSEFGAHLDSFADALTFGVVPAMLAKVLIEHEGEISGYTGNARLHFLAAAGFALMAILRLVRFNLETDHDAEAHRSFRGLPSPAAAGAVSSILWLYLILRRPELEQTEGTPTPMHRMLSWMQSAEGSPVLDWVPIVLVMLLPLLGLLMVSGLRYVHPIGVLTNTGPPFVTLVGIVFFAFLMFLAPVPFLFLLFNGYVFAGVVLPLVMSRFARARAKESASSG